MTSQSTQAIVIGGSMAGLLAARVLSDHFGQVTVIERDKLPEAADYRSGVPQAHHLHILLAHGQALVEQLFPGIEKDFDANGSPRIRWGLDTASYAIAGWTKRFDTGIVSHVTSRVSLEWIIRRRVTAIPNITFMAEQQVNHLLTDEGHHKIIGVHVTSRTDKREQNLNADLVVDCSGRNSKAMEWLVEMAYSAPKETVINSFLGYATRWYQLPDNYASEWTTMLIQSLPQKGLYRGGGMFRVEGNRLVVTLVGMNRDYPPTDENEFMEFAKSLATPTLYNVIKDLEPISPIYGYRRTENRKRHYENLSRLPEGFIVMGDAACSFNPVYGQGMTAAAMEAVELGKLLSQANVTNLHGFPLKFQKQLAKTVQGAWLMATGEDLRYPDTEGGRPGIIDRITQLYMDMMIETFPYDEVLAQAFTEVMNLQYLPQNLLHPRYALRVLRHKLFGHGQVQYSVKQFDFASNHST